MTLAIDFPSRNGVSKSDSVVENKQFLSWPFAVSRILLQLSQKGFVTELMTANAPL